MSLDAKDMTNENIVLISYCLINDIKTMKFQYDFSSSAVYEETSPLTFRTTGDTTSPLFRKPSIKSASGITCVRDSLTDISSNYYKNYILFSL